MNQYLCLLFTFHISICSSFIIVHPIVNKKNIYQMTANFGPKHGTYDLKNISVFHIKSNGCTITTIPNLNNKIAILERGGCVFYIKALNIQKKKWIRNDSG